MAKLWILSDLHLESVPYPDAFAPEPPSFDVLVCAGDVWQGDPARGFRLLRRLAGDKPVVCVLGNHEHWNSVLGKRLTAARRAAEACGVTLLQGDAATIAGCRFVGATLWTDYALSGDTVGPDRETGEAIRIEDANGTKALTIGAAAAQHHVERARLTALIDTHAGPEPLVVVTHHAPHPDCVRPEDCGTFSAGNGASDLSASRLFDRHVGARPTQVARTARVQRAKRLLSETDLPLAMVAMQAGFGSLRRFNAVFAEVYGRPPSQIRRKSAPAR